MLSNGKLRLKARHVVGSRQLRWADNRVPVAYSVAASREFLLGKEALPKVAMALLDKSLFAIT
jgi:hypothetical protein